ncbi:DUF6113 family protein [Nocardioides sp.]|uniref:DUF6113 family protein n=1 Tax=Nocardioides sp. TaxID=35761 RepID=UPI003517CCFC
MRLLLLLASAVGCALLGAVVGGAGVVSHTRLPALLLLLLAAPSTAVALGAGWHRRLAFAAGWVVVVMLALQQRPEGDYLIGQAWRSYVLLALTLGLVLYAVVTLPVRGRRAPRTDAGSVSDQA